MPSPPSSTSFLTLTLITLFLLLITSPPAATSSSPNSLSFIRSSCSKTSYPDLCYDSLSNYATVVRQSPAQLAQVALSVSLNRARYASAAISKLCSSSPAPFMSKRESAAVKDCLDNISDSIYRLGKSIGEVRRVGPGVSGDFGWHISNVQTWVSAALTDENTCMDGFAGREMRVSKVRAAVRNQVVGVAQVTSNALALVNNLAKAKHG